MEITEFNLPLWITPEDVCHFESLNMAIYYGNSKNIQSDYFQPENATTLVFYDLEPDQIKARLRDFIVFSNYLNANQSTILWLSNNSLSNLSLYQKSIDDLNIYLKNNHQVNTEFKWMHSANYKEYPLYDIVDLTVDFEELFFIFCQLENLGDKERKIKELVSLFAYNLSSKFIFNKIYPNFRMTISNYVIILESLINLEIKDQNKVIKCQKCEFETSRKRGMLDLISEYLDLKAGMLKAIKPEVFKDLMNILERHYKTRNSFSHNAYFSDSTKLLNDMMKKIDGKTFYLKDELRHAKGSFEGVFIIARFLRFCLNDHLRDVKIPC